MLEPSSSDPRRDYSRTKRQDLILINTVILPRAFGLLQYYQRKGNEQPPQSAAIRK